MTALATLARMLGLEARNAEAALYSDRVARVALSRRGLMAGGACLATGAAFSFATPAATYVKHELVESRTYARILSRAEAERESVDIARNWLKCGSITMASALPLPASHSGKICLERKIDFVAFAFQPARDFTFDLTAWES